MKIRVICDVVHTDVLLDSNDLEFKQETQRELRSSTQLHAIYDVLKDAVCNTSKHAVGFYRSTSISVLCCVTQTLLSCLLTHLHVVTGRVQFDPLDDTRSALMVPRLDHAVHSWILESLS